MTSQPAPARGALRVTRGAVLAVTSTVLAVAAHTAASGMPPETGMTLLLTAAVAAAGIGLADTLRGTPSVLCALGAAQLGTHLILSFDGRGAMAGEGLAMVAGHALAVLVSAVLLARADTALTALATALGRLLPRVPGPLPVSSAPVALPVRVPPADRALAVLLGRCRRRRGPPPRS